MADNIIRHDVIKLDFDVGGTLKEIKKLQDDLNELKKKLSGGVGDDAFDDLKDSAEKSVSPMKKVKEQAEKIKKSVTDIGKKAATVAFKGLKKLASVSFKALSAGIGAAATAIGGLVAKSVSAFADYEQLVGGVETLLGAKGAKNVEEYAKYVGKSVKDVQSEFSKLKKSESMVLNYANDAYKTAGLSANDYMETVTGFSASLLQSVGGDTVKAAELANVAVSDMADNANKMGTEMGSIQWAYQGFAKQNYTMLDNLKLGYGGTKSEMQRLVKDAAKLDKSVDANSLSYGNIVKAIHAVQVQTGIYGTTQKEAEHTITGSLNAMKSAWGNLLTAIGSGKNLDQCMNNMIDSVEIFGENVIPVAEKAFAGIGKVVEKIVPIIAEKLPSLAQKLLPPLIKSAVELTKGLIKALPAIIKTIAVTIVDIFGEQFPIIGRIAEFFKSNAGTIAKAITGIIPAVVGLAAAFKMFQGIKAISSIFGGKAGGEQKGGVFSIFESLAKAKPTTILKGMANLAIILGGMTAIAAALMALSPYMAQLTDTQSFLKVISAIAILGLVGTGLAKLADIVGKIPIMTVLKGLANIGLVIAGMSALYLLIGAVSLIKFDIGRILQITKIIGALGGIGAALSLFAGLVGLIPIPVVLLGLANIALVLGGMTALIIAFGKLSEVKGFNDFITKGGETLANLFNTIGKIAGSLVGGLGEGITSSLPKIGANLSSFAKSLQPMFAVFKGADMSGIGTFFKSMGSFMLQMAKNDVLSFFTGGTDFAKLGNELSIFANNSQEFFTKVAQFPENGFANATKLFDCLAGIKGLPKEGGVVGWFTGKIDYSKIASGLGQLSSDNVKNFFTMVGGLNAKSFDNVKLFFKSLASIKDLPKEGGWWDKLTGAETTALGNLAKELGSFGEKTESFFKQVNGLNISNLNGLWASLNNSKNVTAEVSKIVSKDIDGIVKKVTDLPKRMADGIKSSGNALSTAFVSIWESAVKATAKPVNKLISGANWILKQFGSNKQVVSWTPYAKGTGGHKGGNALVNDGNGAELVQMPNGKAFIPQGRNVFIPNAPKGMKVLPADRTARLMGKKSPAFRYAKGTGDIDIWDYMDNPKGLISRVSSKFVNYKGTSGLSTHIGKGMVHTISGEMSAWAKKLYDEFGALSLAAYNPSKGVEQWRSTVIRALKMENQYSDANVKRTLYQMQTESGGNPRAINLWDSNAKRGIPSKGLMQVIDPTFQSYARKGFNKNIYDPLSNILASIRYAVARYGTLAKAYRGVGYANGGLVTKTGLIAERNKPEMVIPTDPSKRKRSLGLWAKTGEMLGLSSHAPEQSGYYSSNSVENNTYSPVFNLTITGTNDDRATERKVKRWVKEAMNETFESLERKNTKLREA